MVLRSELFDADVMESLLRLPKGTIPMDTTRALQRYKKRKQNGNTVLIEYDFSVGCRTLKKGRMYPTPFLGLTVFPKEIRAALAKRFYHEIDFENCQVVLFCQVAKKYNLTCEAIEEYAANRPAILNEIQETHSMNRDEAKTICLAVLFGGMRSQHPILPRMKAELNALAIAVNQQHPEYVEAAKKEKSDDSEKWGYKKNPLFGGLAIYIQNEERLCLDAVCDFLEKTDRKMDTLIYDGGLVKRIDESPLPATLLRECEGAVLDKTGYRMVITEKELTHSFDFSRKDRVVPSDVLINDAFATKHFVKLCGENLKRVGSEFYCCIDGVWECGMDKVKKMVESHEQELIFKQYVGDKLKKFDYGGDVTHIKKMLELLPVYAISGDIPIQFAYTLVEEEDETAIQKFLYLCSLACGKKDDLTDYFIKWLAHMIQRPKEQPGVMMVFVGEKGVGKDTPAGIVMDVVVGSKYSHNYTKSAMMFEKHDISMLGKLMVKVEEVKRSECIEHAETIRGLVTGKEIAFNPKNVKETIKMPNWIRFVGTSNTGNPFEMKGERRFVMCHSSSERQGDHAFWADAYTTLFTPAAGRSIGLFLEKVDLAGFVVRSLPHNEYQEDVEETERTSEDKFLADWKGECLTAVELYSQYKDYCLENEIRYTQTLEGFGKRILMLLDKNKIQKKKTNRGKVYWK